MKLLITTIAAVLLVGCGESQESTVAPEPKPDEPIAEVPAQQSPPPVESKPEPPTTQLAKDISLHGAGRNIEAVKQAITDGANVNSINFEHRTPLDNAIRQNYPEVANLLRKHGGKTGEEVSIHAAAKKGNIEAIKQHIANGADVNAEDHLGKTPLDRATGKTADLLRKHGGKTKKELEAAGN